jgi:hypothetical protein
LGKRRHLFVDAKISKRRSFIPRWYSIGTVEPGFCSLCRFQHFPQFSEGISLDFVSVADRFFAKLLTARIDFSRSGNVKNRFRFLDCFRFDQRTSRSGDSFGRVA